jgi:hypothetical protein
MANGFYTATLYESSNKIIEVAFFGDQPFREKMRHTERLILGRAG